MCLISNNVIAKWESFNNILLHFSERGEHEGNERNVPNQKGNCF